MKCWGFRVSGWTCSIASPPPDRPPLGRLPHSRPAHPQSLLAAPPHRPLHAKRAHAVHHVARQAEGHLRGGAGVTRGGWGTRMFRAAEAWDLGFNGLGELKGV